MARYRNRSAAALWYDCSMLPDDETVFLLPHGQGRRFFANDHHLLLRDDLMFGQNQRFPHHGEDDETLILDRNVSEKTIAKHIKTRVVHDHTVDDDGICVVCLDNLVEENRKIARLDCGHQYHHRCIRNWLNVSNTCPLCKATVIIGSAP